MKIKEIYETEKHFLIDIKKSELKVILEDIVKCIKNENREMSIEERNIIRDLNNILE